MRKTTVKNLIHFIIISLPMLLLLIACIFPTKQINNTYALEETTTTQEIEYKYQSNMPNTINDFKVGNYYFFTDENIKGFIEEDKEYNICYFYIDTGSSYINEYFNYGIGNYKFTYMNNQQDITLYFDYYNQDNEYEGQFNIQGQLSLNDVYIGIEFTQDIIDYINNNYNDQDFDFVNYDYSLPSRYNQIIATNNITNNTYNQETLTQVNETKLPNETILTPFKEFYALSINDWYRNVLEVLNINLNNENLVKSYVIYYPVWLMWFYLFELIEMIITAIPRLIMQLIAKIGGGESV